MVEKRFDENTGTDGLIDTDAKKGNVPLETDHTTTTSF